MPQIMVEAFARSLIDKIMLEAFDVVDTNDRKQLSSYTGSIWLNLILSNMQNVTYYVSVIAFLFVLE